MSAPAEGNAQYGRWGWRRRGQARTLPVLLAPAHIDTRRKFSGTRCFFRLKLRLRSQIACRECNPGLDTCNQHYKLYRSSSCASVGWMKRGPCHRPPVRGTAFQRGAAVALGSLILLFNVLAATHAPSHFGATASGLELTQNGKMAICTRDGQLFLSADGTVLPGEPSKPQHGQHECICCMFMQASAVLPPPPPAPVPAEKTAIQILRPGADQHLGAAAVPANRTRGPPSRPSAA